MLLCIRCPLRAQPGDNLIILNHADSLIGMVIGGEEARQLVGNVQFTQGSVVLNCSKAIQYLKSNKVYFEGMVQVRDDSIRMVGQRAVYFPATRTVEAFDRVLLADRTTTLQARYGTYSAADRRAYFRDNVVVADTSMLLTAWEAFYDRDAQVLTADGGVRIEDEARGIVTFSDRFENDRAKKYSRWTGHPRIAQSTRGGGAAPAETLYVSGTTIESYQDTLSRLVVSDSVRIFRDGLAGTAGLVVFHPDGDSISMYRSPYLWYDSGGEGEHQISGDSVSMTLRDNYPDRVRVMGGAVAASETSPAMPARHNQLAGQEIILYFDSTRIRQIDVMRTATSLYYLFENGHPNGLNTSSGRSLRILFSGGRPISINLAESVEGRYIPERLLAGNEREYDIPGFRWRTDRPERAR
ncbi:MAG TPA: OstA-like protein [Bacteroidota bacterium]|nr:OstA-like protein [Bacteroidota bacterium]